MQISDNIFRTHSDCSIGPRKIVRWGSLSFKDNLIVVLLFPLGSSCLLYIFHSALQFELFILVSGLLIMCTIYLYVLYYSSELGLRITLNIFLKSLFFASLDAAGVKGQCRDGVGWGVLSFRSVLYLDMCKKIRMPKNSDLATLDFLHLEFSADLFTLSIHVLGSCLFHVYSTCFWV